ncbi:MAG: Gfo/Idh/MocA family oxidoreductase [Armatimonadetes bacterium]|nr:Gfo/Idh/MocA family oxidoreductase [Armatimonadota bacterium]
MVKSKSKIRIVLVGCGAISEWWLETLKLRSDIDLVGLVDLRLESAEQRVRQFGLKTTRIGTDLDAVLRQTKPEMVFCCTIAEAHGFVTMTALKYGCHVLTEKPLAISLPEARKMIAAAKSKKKVLSVMQNWRHDRGMRSLQSFLQSGRIGRVTTVMSDFRRFLHVPGFRKDNRHTLLLDMAIHTFDAARMLSGVNAESVYCHEWNPPGSCISKDACAQAIFRMEKEIVYNYRGTWTAKGLGTSYESSWHIVGDKGSVSWDGREKLEAEIGKENKDAPPLIKKIKVPFLSRKSFLEGHSGAIEDFLQTVARGKRPETHAEDNIHSLAMVIGAIKSADTGRAVKITA